MENLPDLALSVRQPWAWAIIHAGKDVENRGVMSIRHMRLDGVRTLAIHARRRESRSTTSRTADCAARTPAAWSTASSTRRSRSRLRRDCRRYDRLVPKREGYLYSHVLFSLDDAKTGMVDFASRQGGCL